jgi:hypothetical protein
MPTALTTQSVWSTEPRLWPKAGRAYVFLAEAFTDVGNSLFKDEWTGREAFPPAYPLREEIARATTPTVIRAPAPIRPLGSGLTMTRSKMEQDCEARQRSIQHWKEACDARWAKAKPQLEAEEQAATRLVQRRNEAAAWIADRGRNGEVVTYGLWTGLGLPARHLPASIWNGTDDWELFAKCIAKNVYIPTVGPVACDYYLFIGRDGFDSALRTLAATPGRRGGSKPQYRWDEFIAEAVRRLDDEGDFGPDWQQTELEQQMARWCSDKWGKEPSESSIRLKVKEAQEEFIRNRSG